MYLLLIKTVLQWKNLSCCKPTLHPQRKGRLPTYDHENMSLLQQKFDKLDLKTAWSPLSVRLVGIVNFNPHLCTLIVFYVVYLNGNTSLSLIFSNHSIKYHPLSLQ